MLDGFDGDNMLADKLLLLALTMSGALLGVMLFFSLVVAPNAFVRLGKEEAGTFIRGIFPWYYLVQGVLAVGAMLLLGSQRQLEPAIIGAVALLAVFSRQVLMPRINALRDRELAGDGAAGAMFGRLHSLSVLINTLQLLGVVGVIVLLVVDF